MALVIDPANQPVANASIGRLGSFGDFGPKYPRASFWRGANIPVVLKSVANGKVDVDAALEFSYRFTNDPAVPIVVLDEPDGLMAYEELHREEFGSDKVR